MPGKGNKKPAKKKNNKQDDILEEKEVKPKKNLKNDFPDDIV